MGEQGPQPGLRDTGHFCCLSWVTGHCVSRAPRPWQANLIDLHASGYPAPSLGPWPLCLEELVCQGPHMLSAVLRAAATAPGGTPVHNTHPQSDLPSSELVGMAISTCAEEGTGDRAFARGRGLSMEVDGCRCWDGARVPAPHGAASLCARPGRRVGMCQHRKSVCSLAAGLGTNPSY